MAIFNEQPYYLDPDFENALVWKCVTSPSFFGRIFKELNPDLLGQPHAKLLVRAAQIVNSTTGRGPASPTIALARLTELSNDGKLSIGDLDTVRAWVKKYKSDPDATAVDESAVLDEIVPMLQKRMKHRAAREMLDRVGKGGDTRRVVTTLADAENLGLNDKSIGVKLGRASFEQVRQLRALQKLKTGIVDLDFHIGGLTRGHFGVIIGGPGDGKSMGLIHVAAAAMRAGMLVAYATLELDEAIVLSRLMANVTGIPIDSVMGSAAERAEARIAELQESGAIGGFIVKYFTPQATSVDDIKDWCGSIRDEYGRMPDLLVIDYVDKMGFESESAYTGMMEVCEGLRIYGRDNDMPVWTASQAKAKGKDHKQLGLYSAADSLHKVRVADLVITLNVTEDRKEIRIYVAKNRVGEAGQTVGPLPTAFGLGRLVNIPSAGVDFAKTRKKVKDTAVDMSLPAAVEAEIAQRAAAEAAGTPKPPAAPLRDLTDEQDQILAREIIEERESATAPPSVPVVVKRPGEPAAIYKLTPPTRPAMGSEPAPKVSGAGRPVAPIQAAPIPSTPTPAPATAGRRAAELADGWRTDTDTDDAAPAPGEKCKYCRRPAVAHERCDKHADL